MGEQRTAVTAQGLGDLPRLEQLGHRQPVAARRRPQPVWTGIEDVVPEQRPQPGQLGADGRAADVVVIQLDGQLIAGQALGMINQQDRTR